LPSCRSARDPSWQRRRKTSEDSKMNDYQQGYLGAQGQLMPQGLFGGLLGGPVGGLIGRGIGGLFGNPGLGSQIGQVAGGIGGSLLPFGTDPMTAYLQQMQQAQQQQFTPQGAFGDFLGQVGQPLGNALGGAFGNAQLGGTIGNLAGQLGKMLPFGLDPMAAAYGQQQDFSPQNIMGIPPAIRDRILSTLPRFPNTGWPSFGSLPTASPNFQKLLPFGVDPMAAAAYEQQLQQQQQQLAPQGFFGNLLGSVGKPLGGLIGGAFGNAGLGSTIGGVAGQFGRMLPFGVDPMAAQQQAMQQQAMQQQALQQHALQQHALQQQQLAPQGAIGNFIGQYGQPIGNAIGGAFGNAQLGGTIGSLAGQLGKMLPFGADPYSQQYAGYPQGAQAMAGPFAGGQQAGGFGGQQPTIH
jgi:hypothetical protein